MLRGAGALGSGEIAGGGAAHPIDQGTMKTNHDLLREFLRYFFDGVAADPALASRVDALQAMAERQFRPTGEPKRLSDSEYAETLAKMKAEAPAFLHYLLTEVPERFEN